MSAGADKRADQVTDHVPKHTVDRAADLAVELASALDYWNCFKPDYSAARTAFIAAAQAVGARLTSYAHPDAKGPSGEDLSIDVAVLGVPTAPRVLFALSGTHGLEGPAGSAVQIAYLRTLAAHPVPEGVAVVLLHGLNPFGFAHGSRTTENNVDLNRNFIDHTAPYPLNTLYAQLHAALLPEHWTGATLAAAAQASEQFRRVHGDDVLFDTLARGQYTHAQGLMFGGQAREWSNHTLETIVEQHLKHAKQIAFIDWHTGIGEYGEPFFLCFNASGGPLEAEAARWWGTDHVIGQRPNGLARPNYRGLVFHGVERFLQGRPMVGAVVEFGTRGKATASASRLDQWLRFKAPNDPDPARDAQLHADVVDAMVPTSSVWRNAVIAHGLRITHEAIDGLVSWTTAHD